MAGIVNGIEVTGIRSGISCEECGLKFDSFTSLEVHVAYHKENLLDKWRQQGNFTSDLSNHSGSPISLIDTGIPSHQNGPLDNGSARPAPGTVLTMNGNGHNVIYLPSYYRNNAQFHNSNIAPAYSGEIHGFYNGSLAHDSPTPSLQIPHPNLCLSAPMDTDHHNRLEKLGTDAGAEILDLDSNTVHVVNNNPGQADHSARGQFYRPFLNGVSTPSASHCAGSWAPAADQEAGIMKTYVPPPREIVPSIVYSQAQMHSGPTTSNANRQDPSGGPFVHDVKQVPSQSNDRTSLGTRILSEQSPANIDKDLAGTPPAFGTPEPPDPSPANSKSVSSTTKVKGWKGGECKRPKTYNCTACNKWFTSSGHLKRHYGTTLHKNSIRQLGEDGVREQNNVPPKGPAAKNKRNSVKKNGVANSEFSDYDLKDGSISGTTSRPADQRKGDVQAGRDKGIANGHKAQGVHDVRISDTVMSRSPDTHTSSSSSSTTGDEKFQLGKHGDSSISISRSPYEDAAQMTYTYSYPPNPPHSFSPSVGLSAPAVIDNTSIYNTGYNVAPIQLNGGLPPFSSVGYSHYDPHLFPHLNPNLGQHYPNSGPNGTGLNNSAYYSSPGMVTSPFPNAPQAPPSHAERSGTNSGSPEPEVGRSGDLEYRNFDDESVSNSPSRDLGSSGGESFVEESPMEQAAVFRCSECPKTFGRGCYLTQHMNSSHVGLPFKCTTCGKKFLEADALTEHIRKHGDDKPFRCEHDQCLKQFNHKTDLRRHLCLHTGEKPFICKTCGKGFIRKDHMNKHSETHRKKLKDQGQGTR